MLLTLAQAEAKYGQIVGGKWAREAEFCTMLQLPGIIHGALVNTVAKTLTSHIYCNKDMADPLLQAFNNVRVRGLLNELRTFDGCYEVRDVRGAPGQVSTHAYALAIDLNAAENPLGGPVKFSPAFVACFKDAGFKWGGDFHRVDGMHFQLADW